MEHGEEIEEHDDDDDINYLFERWDFFFFFFEVKKLVHIARIVQGMEEIG